MLILRINAAADIFSELLRMCLKILLIVLFQLFLIALLNLLYLWIGRNVHGRHEIRHASIFLAHVWLYRLSLSLRSLDQSL